VPLIHAWLWKGSRFLGESMQWSCSDAIAFEVLRHLLAAS
jgi:hypothetical protein